MLHIITGGSGSGKSAWAEDEAVRLSRMTAAPARKYYIATMEPFGEETMRKIERHRKLREGKGFETIECYTDPGKAAKIISAEMEQRYLKQEAVVLLECMSNLVANELYRPDGAGDDAVMSVTAGVERLCSVAAHVVIVTNEVCSECASDSEEMRKYKRILSEINCCIACMADRVTEVVYGIPVEVKR